MSLIAIYVIVVFNDIKKLCRAKFYLSNAARADPHIASVTWLGQG